MSQRQFVAVKFRIGDTRTYTYVNDGEPVTDGDVVRVADARSDGWQKVYVVSTTDEAPPFECKPILGLHTEDETVRDLLVDVGSTDPLDAPILMPRAPAPATTPGDPFGLPSLD
jgi:hypothetical protein